MISKKHRFRGNRAIDYVYKNSRPVRYGSFTLRHKISDDNYRAAVVVSKKVHKSAVTRNRIRRRVFEYLRLNLSEDTKGDILITVYDESVAKISADELKTQLNKLLKKAQIS